MSAILELMQSGDFDPVSVYTGNKDKFLEIKTAIISNDLPKDVCIKFLVTKVAPAVFNKNVDNSIRDEVVEIGFCLLQFVNISLLDGNKQAQLLNTIGERYTVVIGELRDSNYTNWDKLWIFLLKLGSKNLLKKMSVFNKLLRIVEDPFRSHSTEQRLKAYDCWKELIDICSLDMDFMCKPKHIKLLVTPMRAKFYKNTFLVKRCDTFVFLLEKLQEKATLCLREFLEFGFGPLNDNDRIKQGTSAPEVASKCTHVLFEIIGHSHSSLETCLESNDLHLCNTLINNDTFPNFAEILIYSVVECCISLNEWSQDRQLNSTIIKCLWRSLLQLVHHSTDDTKKKCCSQINTLLGKILKNSENNDFTSILGNVIELLVQDPLLSEFQETVFKIVLELLWHIKIDSGSFLTPEVLEFIESSLDGDNHVVFHEMLCASFKNSKKCENPDQVVDIWSKCKIPLTSENIRTVLWPIRYLSDLKDVKVLNTKWMKMFNTECKPENKSALIQEVGKLFRENPLLASNIIQFLQLLLASETNPGRDFVTKFMRVIELVLTMPHLTDSDVKKLSSIVLACCNQSLPFYKSENIDEILDKLCTCLEHLVSKHEQHAVLPELQKQLQNCDPKILTKFSKRLMSFLEMLMLNSENSITNNVRKLIELLETKEDKSETVALPSTRSMRIVNLTNVTPKTKKLGNQAKNTPKGNKASPLPMTKNKTVFTPTSRNRRMVELTLMDEKSSDFVKIDTEVKIDLQKLSEHQKEMLKKRRDDIPALYEDLTHSQSQSEDLFKTDSQEGETNRNVGQEKATEMNQITGQEVADKDIASPLKDTESQKMETNQEDQDNKNTDKHNRKELCNNNAVDKINSNALSETEDVEIEKLREKLMNSVKKQMKKSTERAEKTTEAAQVNSNVVKEHNDYSDAGQQPVRKSQRQLQRQQSGKYDRDPIYSKNITHRKQRQPNDLNTAENQSKKEKEKTVLPEKVENVNHSLLDDLESFEEKQQKIASSKEADDIYEFKFEGEEIKKPSKGRKRKSVWMTFGSSKKSKRRKQATKENKKKEDSFHITAESASVPLSESPSLRSIPSEENETITIVITRTPETCQINDTTSDDAKTDTETYQISDSSSTPGRRTRRKQSFDVIRNSEDVIESSQDDGDLRFSGSRKTRSLKQKTIEEIFGAKEPDKSKSSNDNRLRRRLSLSGISEISKPITRARRRKSLDKDSLEDNFTSENEELGQTDNIDTDKDKLSSHKMTPQRRKSLDKSLSQADTLTLEMNKTTASEEICQTETINTLNKIESDKDESSSNATLRRMSEITRPKMRAQRRKSLDTKSQTDTLTLEMNKTTASEEICQTETINTLDKIESDKTKPSSNSTVRRSLSLRDISKITIPTIRTQRQKSLDKDSTEVSLSQADTLTLEMTKTTASEEISQSETIDTLNKIESDKDKSSSRCMSEITRHKMPTQRRKSLDTKSSQVTLSQADTLTLEMSKTTASEEIESDKDESSSNATSRRMSEITRSKMRAQRRKSLSQADTLTLEMNKTTASEELCQTETIKTLDKIESEKTKPSSNATVRRSSSLRDLSKITILKVRTQRQKSLDKKSSPQADTLSLEMNSTATSEELCQTEINKIESDKEILADTQTQEAVKTKANEAKKQNRNKRSCFLDKVESYQTENDTVTLETQQTESVSLSDSLDKNEKSLLIEALTLETVAKSDKSKKPKSKRRKHSSCSLSDDSVDKLMLETESLNKAESDKNTLPLETVKIDSVVEVNKTEKTRRRSPRNKVESDSSADSITPELKDASETPTSSPKRKKRSKSPVTQTTSTLETEGTKEIQAETVTCVTINDTTKDLPSSPITCETPDRTTELLNNTLDISPISSETPGPSVTSTPKPPPSEVPNIRVARLLQMANFNVQVSNAGTKWFGNSLSSPCIRKVRKMKMKKEEEIDLLTFSREIPSPLVHPASGILKRKFEGDGDVQSPCPKRKRVNFSDPATTSKKVFIKDADEYHDYHDPFINGKIDDLEDGDETSKEVADMFENAHDRDDTDNFRGFCDSNFKNFDSNEPKKALKLLMQKLNVSEIIELVSEHLSSDSRIENESSQQLVDKVVMPLLENLVKKSTDETLKQRIREIVKESVVEKAADEELTQEKREDYNKLDRDRINDLNKTYLLSVQDQERYQFLTEWMSTASRELPATKEAFSFHANVFQEFVNRMTNCFCPVHSFDFDQ